MAIRFPAALVGTAAAAVSLLASAQPWSVQSGVTARGEYTDNYFFAPVDQQSAFTATVSPFVTAARRTETTDVTALLAVGGNVVWGQVPPTEYLSGRLGLNGSLREARSTWTGNLSFVRDPTLQSELRQTGVVLALAYRNAASLNGAYTYELTERWSLGATAGGYNNHYDTIQAGGTLSNNNGYYAGGRVGYAYSDRTQVTFSAAYSHYESDITSSDYVTTTLGVVHQFSPRLTISASAGRFWSDTEALQTAFVCPVAPIQCDTGLVPRVPIATGNQRRDNGPLYGGNISYALSERTQIAAILSESLVPSGTGTLTKSDNAGASLSHRFADRLTGRLGVSYTRTVFPAALSGSFTNNYYAGEAGVSYKLAERWSLDASYRYARAEYSQNPSTTERNVVFVSIGYNWPGSSFTDWVGTRTDTQGLPGAGPVPLSEPARESSDALKSPEAPGASSEPASPQSSPFDAFTIP